MTTLKFHQQITKARVFAYDLAALDIASTHRHGYNIEAMVNEA